jgi:hypothetical protein
VQTDLQWAHPTCSDLHPPATGLAAGFLFWVKALLQKSSFLGPSRRYVLFRSVTIHEGSRLLRGSRRVAIQSDPTVNVQCNITPLVSSKTCLWPSYFLIQNIFCNFAQTFCMHSTWFHFAFTVRLFDLNLNTAELNLSGSAWFFG